MRKLYHSTVAPLILDYSLPDSSISPGCIVDNRFFEHPVLNSPYACPKRHWELDAQGQPTQGIIESRRLAEFITPIPKPKKRKTAVEQQHIIFDEGKGLSTDQQQYDPTPIINELRYYVDQWRNLSNPSDWHVTPETARLLQHWRHHNFNDIRPFFCQVEAVETVIWLTEVAPSIGKTGSKFLDHMANANNDANPELMRLALKLATGAGKTTVMAMLIAWQTVNAVRHPNSKKFTRGFLIVTPGITIKDRLRVWIPGVNNNVQYGRWAFAEFTEVYQMEIDFEAKIEGEFNKMIETVSRQPVA